MFDTSAPVRDWEWRWFSTGWELVDPVTGVIRPKPKNANSGTRLKKVRVPWLAEPREYHP